MSKTQLCQLLHHSIFSNRDPSLSELNELSQEVAATFFAAQTLKKMIFDYITQHKLKQISDNEMVNVLIVTNHIILHQPSFRLQITDFDFLHAIQQLGHFKYSHQYTLTLLEKKTQEFVTNWVTSYPYELFSLIDFFKLPISTPSHSIFLSLVPAVQDAIKKLLTSLQKRSSHLSKHLKKAQIIYEKFSIQNQQYIKLNGTSSQLQGNDQLELLLKKCIDEAQRRINEKSKKKNEKSLKPAKKLGGSIISVQQLEVRSPLSSGTTSCSFYDDNILEEIELVRSRSNSREREVESTANKRPSSSSFVVVKGNNLNKHINSRNSTNLSIFNDDVDFKVDRPYSSSTINVPVSHSDGLLRSELTRYESPSLS